MWEILEPVTKLVSPSLHGGLLTTGPPGKCQHMVFKTYVGFYDIDMTILIELSDHSYRLTKKNKTTNYRGQKEKLEDYLYD